MRLRPSSDADDDAGDRADDEAEQRLLACVTQMLVPERALRRCPR